MYIIKSIKTQIFPIFNLRVYRYEYNLMISRKCSDKGVEDDNFLEHWMLGKQGIMIKNLKQSKLLISKILPRHSFCKKGKGPE